MPLSAQGQHDSKVVILVFVKWPPSEAIKGRAFVLIWFGFSRQSIFRLCEPVKEDQHLSRNVFRTTFDSSFSPISTFAKLKSAKIKVVIEMSQSVIYLFIYFNICMIDKRNIMSTMHHIKLQINGPSGHCHCSHLDFHPPPEVQQLSSQIDPC